MDVAEDMHSRSDFLDGVGERGAAAMIECEGSIKDPIGWTCTNRNKKQRKKTQTHLRTERSEQAQRKTRTRNGGTMCKKMNDRREKKRKRSGGERTKRKRKGLISFHSFSIAVLSRFLRTQWQNPHELKTRTRAGRKSKRREEQRKRKA